MCPAVVAASIARPPSGCALLSGQACALTGQRCDLGRTGDRERGHSLPGPWSPTGAPVWRRRVGRGKTFPMESIVEQLSEEESLRLAAGSEVGRIGFTGRYGPIILPVNFADRRRGRRL